MGTDAVAVSIKDIQDAPPSKKLNRSMTSTSIPDASIPVKKLMYALLAISMGTVIEWFDFTIYTQMSKLLGKVFFPSNDPVLQALSFWGVFFVGYISRPAGALLFGHLGDTKGRSKCLLISVLTMGVPTVLIGCLPTYAHIGIAAPILLALLRLVQGLAMGGEFGAAMVYLHEIADPRYKAVTGSLGYISLGVGVVIGILVVICVTQLISPENLLVWGWRIPFLLAVTTLIAATLLRWNMPESTEFATSREEIEEDYRKKLREYKRRHRKDKLAALNMPTATPAATADGVKDADSVAKIQRQQSDVESVKDPETEKHYVPLTYLLKNHWHGLILQTGYEAWIGAGFYLGYSWLPSFFATHAGQPAPLTLWMVLVSMVIFTFIVPIAGLMSDKGLRRVNTTIVICIVAAATHVPMFLAFRTKSLAACWLLQIVLLSMVAWTMGILPAICSSIYPAGVRISGFNLGYNLGMTLFGGCAPLIMSAIQTGTGSIFIGPGLWMTGMALVSIVSCLGLIKWYPHTNECD